MKKLIGYVSVIGVLIFLLALDSTLSYPSEKAIICQILALTGRFDGCPSALEQTSCFPEIIQGIKSYLSCLQLLQGS